MFGKRASGKVVLVADVEDSSVGVAIVRLLSDRPATILISRRKNLSFEERAPEQLAAGVIQLLDEQIEAVLKSYATAEPHGAPPYAVYGVLHAPWTRFRTARTDERYEKPRTITKNLLSDAAEKALAAAPEFDQTAILEAGIQRVFINGYPTDTPLGKSGSLLSVVAFEAEARPEMKKSVIATIGKYVPGREPIIKCGLRALLTVIHEHTHDIHRYVILNVGGTTTMCTVVREEAVAQSAVVAEGHTTVLKRISGAGLPEETLSQLRMLLTDTCATDACKALKDSLARTEPEITKVYGEAFASLAAQQRLPNAVILFAPSEMLSWYEGFFSRIDFAQFTATAQPFVVESFSPEHMTRLVEWPSKASADTGVGVAAGYVHILEQGV